MSDSDSKPSPSVPQWQQRSPNPSPSPTSDGRENDNSDSSRSALLEQASKFLQEDSIRDAPTDRKITFLESKGLTATEIESLLGVSRNPEATTATSSQASSTEEEDKKKETTATASTDNIPNRPSSTGENNSGSQPSAQRDVPPIITYPEFLLHQSKPPPLVSLPSVLYTLYGAAGLGASIYGASEYIVKPMLTSLTTARHDLAQTAQENLKKLNEKLEQNVSRVPPGLSTKQRQSDTTSEEDGDVDTESISITSDPTELFHRDIGTQTQDLPDKQGLLSASTDPTAEGEETLLDPTKAVSTHQTRLQSIASHLRDFADAQSQSSTLEDTTRTRLNDLQHYLDGLLFSRHTHSYGSPISSYNVYSTPGTDSGSGAATGIAKGEEDAMASLRAEIRGVKGALLSARNFPAGRGAKVAGVSR